MVADVVDDENVGVVQRAGGTRLLLETPEAIGIIRNRGRQDLDRHLAPEPGIPYAMHLTHFARANRCDDLVGTESRAGRKGHDWWPL